MALFKKVLVATDFSTYSDEAVEVAIKMVQDHGGSLVLLHAFEPPFLGNSGIDFNMGPEIHQWFSGLKQRVEEKLGEQVREIRKRGIEVEPVIREGVPYVEIIKGAEEALADLIVLGTHGRTGMAHVLLGSVAERVVRKAQCPVLTIRPEKMAA